MHIAYVQKMTETSLVNHTKKTCKNMRNKQFEQSSRDAR